MKKLVTSRASISLAWVLLFAVFIGYTGCERKPAVTPPKKVAKIKIQHQEFPYRKYTHIKAFYAPIAKETIDLALKYNIPPAAILAIASVESGYGRGYVARITGNILSLGAGRGEKELPALYLPTVKKSGEVLYDPARIKKYTKEELSWKKRPKSLKKDYRPSNVAGTKEELAYFDYHESLHVKAQLANIEDFATKWISLKKPFKPFQEARTLVDEAVSNKGKEILFDAKLNEAFINTIGGRPNSFNYRKTWPKKVNIIMQKADLVRLTKNMYESKSSLDDVW